MRTLQVLITAAVIVATVLVVDRMEVAAERQAERSGTFAPANPPRPASLSSSSR